jgi:hypothetical protein
MDRLQSFLDHAASAPPERDGRHFRAWQRVSVQVQREVRSLVLKIFFAEQWRAGANLDRAFTIVVYSSCHPCYGRRPMEFTYDICELALLSAPLHLVGRSMQARLAQIIPEFQGDARMKRRFAPVWHLDILNIVKKKPRLLIELLAREAAMINALIDMGALRRERSTKRFLKTTSAAARVLGVNSATLQDLVLRTAIENLGDGRVFEDEDVFSPGSPDARIGGNENRDHGSAYGCGQVAYAGIVPDIYACS